MEVLSVKVRPSIMLNFMASFIVAVCGEMFFFLGPGERISEL